MTSSLPSQMKQVPIALLLIAFLSLLVPPGQHFPEMLIVFLLLFFSLQVPFFSGPLLTSFISFFHKYLLSNSHVQGTGDPLVSRTSKAPSSWHLQFNREDRTPQLQCSRTCAFKGGLRRPGTTWLDTCCSSQVKEEFLRKSPLACKRKLKKKK